MTVLSTVMTSSLHYLLSMVYFKDTLTEVDKDYWGILKILSRNHPADYVGLKISKHISIYIKLTQCALNDSIINDVHFNNTCTNLVQAYVTETWRNSLNVTSSSTINQSSVSWAIMVKGYIATFFLSPMQLLNPLLTINKNTEKNLYLACYFKRLDT